MVTTEMIRADNKIILNRIVLKKLKIFKKHQPPDRILTLV